MIALGVAILVSLVIEMSKLVRRIECQRTIS
jgi:hypothetical protein